MSIITGYTICFLSEGLVRQLTMVLADDAEIERLLVKRFGEIEIISRTPLGPRELQLLQLKVGGWVE